MEFVNATTCPADAIVGDQFADLDLREVWSTVRRTRRGRPPIEGGIADAQLDTTTRSASAASIAAPRQR
jgi:hypothetical protein